MAIKTLNELQVRVQELSVIWAGWGLWQEPPGPRDSLDFMVTELGEAVDARILVENAGYTRNNPDSGLTWADVDVEVADIVIMALRYFTARKGWGGSTVDRLPPECPECSVIPPTARDCLDRMVIAMGRAVEGRVSAEIGEIIRWVWVDNYVAATLKAAQSYFNLRGVSLIETALGKLARMHAKKQAQVDSYVAEMEAAASEAFGKQDSGKCP